MYTAVVIEKDSRERLLGKFAEQIPDDWEIYADHVTINMGSIEEGPLSQTDLNKKVSLYINSFGMDDKVMAVGVVMLQPSVNKIPHITLAVNRLAGGKPVMSNALKYRNILPKYQIKLFGTIKEVR